MIKVEMTELAVEKVKKIREALDKEEIAWLENCVAAQISALQAEATNLPLSKPQATLAILSEETAFPKTSVAAIKEAAILQTFLDVLKEMRNKDTKFHTARLTVI